MAQRGDEIVPPPRDGDDVATAALSVAEGAAQRADLHLQICFFDDGFRPGSGHQLFLADNLAGTLDQSGQDIEGPAAEPYRCVALNKQPLRCEQPERAQGDRVSGHRVAPWLHTFFYL